LASPQGFTVHAGPRFFVFILRSSSISSSIARAGAAGLIVGFGRVHPATRERESRVLSSHLPTLFRGMLRAPPLHEFCGAAVELVSSASLAPLPLVRPRFDVCVKPNASLFFSLAFPLNAPLAFFLLPAPQIRLLKLQLPQN